MNKKYWLKLVLFGAVFAFFFIYIIEENNLFEYGFRQQHPYLASMHRVVADTPTYIAIIMTPSFCKPVITKYGSSSCWETFKIINNIIEFLEILFMITLFGYIYGKIKNRNKVV